MSSAFRNWNTVIVKYCDASSYLGQNISPVTIGRLQYFFRGHYILRAIIHDLKAQFGLESATKVVVGGHSAGAMTVLLHLEYFRRVLPGNLLAIADGGYFMDIQEFPEGQEETRRYADGLRMWNATSLVHRGCLADNKASPWRCIIPQVLLRYLRLEVPLLLVHSKYDHHPLKVFAGIQEPKKAKTKEALARIHFIGSAIAHGIRRLNASWWIAGCSAAFDRHFVTTEPFCHNYRVQNETACSAVAKWSRSHGRSQLRLFEDCVHPCSGGSTGECLQQ
eukprot:TRINITY_DN25870_c0_g1_i2.p1 TRINITY_DN25870_c0_g1~~TRINITY_DN25870_c0_g1_i2.p1  ORF type:complete len:278 (-),score=35.66 TRINITY_DN25870_c0_g1_i2:160-993(-)